MIREPIIYCDETKFDEACLLYVGSWQDTSMPCHHMQNGHSATGMFYITLIVFSPFYYEWLETKKGSFTLHMYDTLHVFRTNIDFENNSLTKILYTNWLSYGVENWNAFRLVDDIIAAWARELAAFR